jgi:DNA-binding transcriptional regulator YhcF (GntR family)
VKEVGHEAGLSISIPLSRQHYARRAETGDKVPAIRVLAEELKVARKTVETAYAILTGEGYLVSQGARGTRVNPDLLLPGHDAPAEQATGPGIAD